MQSKGDLVVPYVWNSSDPLAPLYTELKRLMDENAQLKAMSNVNTLLSDRKEYIKDAHMKAKTREQVFDEAYALGVQSYAKENEKYRKALERIRDHDGHRHSTDPDEIAREALQK